MPTLHTHIFVIFYLIFTQIMPVNVKLDISRHKRIDFKVGDFIDLVDFQRYIKNKVDNMAILVFWKVCEKPYSHWMSALMLWISPEPIWILAPVLMLTLTIGVNGAIEINGFLPCVNTSINTGVNADAWRQHSFKYNISPSDLTSDGFLKQIFFCFLSWFPMFDGCYLGSFIWFHLQ